jgi:predicted chitinase
MDSTSLGEVALHFIGDVSHLESSLRDIQKKAIATAQSIEKAMGGIGKSGLKLNITVNYADLGLTNKRIGETEQRLKNAQGYFDRNPLRIRVDTSELDGAEKRIAEVQTKIGATADKNRSVSGKESYESAKPREQSLGIKSDAIAKEIEKGFSKAKPKIGGGIGLGGIFRGATEKLGASLISGFSEGLSDSFNEVTGKLIGSPELLGRSILNKLIPQVGQTLGKARLVKGVGKLAQDSGLGERFSSGVNAAKNLIGADEIELEQRYVRGKQKTRTASRNKAIASELGSEYEQFLIDKPIDEIEREIKQKELAQAKKKKKLILKNYQEFLNKDTEEQINSLVYEPAKQASSQLGRVEQAKGIVQGKLDNFKSLEDSGISLSEEQSGERKKLGLQMQALKKRETTLKAAVDKKFKFEASSAPEKLVILQKAINQKVVSITEIEKRIQALESDLEQANTREEFLERLLSQAGVETAGITKVRADQEKLKPKVEAKKQARIAELKTSINKRKQLIKFFDEKIANFSKTLASETNTELIALINERVEKLNSDRAGAIEALNLDKEQLADVRQNFGSGFREQATAEMGKVQAEVVQRTGANGKESREDIGQRIAIQRLRNLGKNQTESLNKVKNLEFETPVEAQLLLAKAKEINASVEEYERQAEAAINIAAEAKKKNQTIKANQVVVQGSAVTGTGGIPGAKPSTKKPQLPAAYLDIVRDVAKASGIENYEDLIPKPEAFSEKDLDFFKQKGVDPTAGYIGGKSNKIKLLPEQMKALQSGAINDDLVGSFAHELRHWVQEFFDNQIEQLRPTAEEYKADPRLAEKIEGSTSLGSGDKVKEQKLRDDELDAYTFEMRNKQAIAARVKRASAIREIEQTAGSGGGKLKNELDKAKAAQFNKLGELVQGKDYDVTGAQELLEAKFEKINGVADKYIAQVQSIDSLSDQDVNLLYKSIQAVLSTIVGSVSGFADQVDSELLNRAKAELEMQLKGGATTKARLVDIAKANGISTKGNKKDIADNLLKGMSFSGLKAQAPVPDVNQLKAIQATQAFSPQEIVEYLKERQSERLDFSDLKEDYALVLELLNHELEEDVKKSLQAAKLSIGKQLRAPQSTAATAVDVPDEDLENIKLKGQFINPLEAAKKQFQQAVQGIQQTSQKRQFSADFKQGLGADQKAFEEMQRAYDIAQKQREKLANEAIGQFDKDAEALFAEVEALLQERMESYEQAILKADELDADASLSESQATAFDNQQELRKNRKKISQQEAKGLVVDYAPLRVPVDIKEPAGEFRKLVGEALGDMFSGVAERVRKQAQILERETPALMADLTASATVLSSQGEDEEALKLVDYQSRLKGLTEEQSGLSSKRNLSPEEVKRLAEINQEVQKIYSTFDRTVPQVNGFFDALFTGGTVAQKVGGMLKGLLGSFLSFMAIGKVVELAKQFAPAFIDAAIAMESLERRVNFVSGNFAAGAENMAYLREEASRLGIDLKQATEGFVGLAAATKDTALEGTATKQVSSAVNQAAAVYGLDAQSTERAYTAFSQIASKGKLQSEELRGQLSECYCDNTEVLTAFGFIRWEDVTEDHRLATKELKSGQVSYVKPRRLVKYWHSGLMYKVSNQGVDLLVTPNHRMIVKDVETGVVSIIQASSLEQKPYIYLTSVNNETGALVNPSDTEWIDYEGYVYCAEVEHTTLFVRRNNKTAWSGNSLPGAFQVAARSMGVTTQELGKMLEQGQVLSEDFLPKFAQQLSAETASGVAGAAGSSVSSLNNFNNAIFETQAALGEGLLPARNAGLEVLATGLNLIRENAGLLVTVFKFLGVVLAFNVGKSVLNVVKSFALMRGEMLLGANAVKTLGASKVGMVGLANAVTGVGSALKGMLFAAGPMLLQFLAFAAVVAVVDQIRFAFSDAGGTVREFADRSKASMKEFRESLAESRGEIDKFNEKKEKLGFWGNVKKGLDGIDNGVGGFFEKIGVKPVGDFFKTKEKKTLDDSSRASNDLIAGSKDTVAVSQSADVKQIVSEITTIDKKLKEVQMKRRALIANSPGDIEGLKKLKAEEEALLKEREGKYTPVGQLSAKFQAEVDGLKKGIEEYEAIAGDSKVSEETRDAYSKKAGELKTQLDAAEKAQNDLNKSIGDGVNGLKLLARQFQDIADRLADANAKSQQQGNLMKGAVASKRASGFLTPGQEQAYNAAIEQQLIDAQLKDQTLALREQKALLDTDENRQIMQSYGATEETGAAGFKTLAERAADGTPERALFEKQASIKEQESQVADIANQLEQRKADVRRQMEELSRSITEYYRGIDRSSQEIALTAQQQAKVIATTEAKTKLKSAVVGVQDNFVSQFIDSIIGIMESLDQPFEEGLKAQQEALKNQFQYEDQYKQGTELRKQLPGENGLTTQDNIQGMLPALYPGASGVTAISSGQNFEGLQASATEANEAIAALNAGLQASGTELQQATENVANTGISLEGLKEKAVQVAAVPAGETLVEKAVGTNEQIQAKATTFDSIFSQIKSQWKDTSDVDGYWQGVQQRAGNLGRAVQTLGDGLGQMWNESTQSAGAFFSNTDGRLAQVQTATGGWNLSLLGVNQSIGFGGQLTQMVADVMSGSLQPATEGVNKSISGSHPLLKAASGFTQGIQKEAKKLSGFFAYNIPVLTKVGQFMKFLINSTKEWGQWVGQVINQFIQSIPTIGEVGKAIANSRVGQAVGNAWETVQNSGVGRAIGSAWNAVTGQKGDFGYASPSAKQDWNKVLGGSVSAGQSLRAGRGGGTRLHNGIDFDSTEGLTTGDVARAMFPGLVENTNVWGGQKDTQGNTSSAVRVRSALPGGGEFLTDYGHVTMESLGVKKGQEIGAGSDIAKLASGGDYGSTGGHLDVKIQVPTGVAQQAGLATGSAGKTGGMVYVDVKQFMKWYQSQVDKMPADQRGGASKPASQQTSTANQVSDPRDRGINTARPARSNSNAVIANAGDYTKRSREDNIQTIVNEAIKLGVTDKAQISYIVATALHESGNFRYFEEQGADSRFAHYEGGAKYKGRGMVQLTHKSNYAKQGQRLGLDLVNNPELIRDANVAANILVHGMITGGFTGKKVSQYLGNGKNDVSNARRTVNGYVQAQVNQVNAKYNEVAPNIDQYIARAGQGGQFAQAPAATAIAPALQPMQQIASAEMPDASLPDIDSFIANPNAYINGSSSASAAPRQGQQKPTASRSPAPELSRQGAVILDQSQAQLLANNKLTTNLANQQATANTAWSTLQSKIQEGSAQFQKERGLQDLEGRINSTQDQLQRDLIGLDRNEPRRQAKEAELSILTEYRDKNRDLLRQRDEVAAAVATTERSIKLFNEAINDPNSGLTGEQKALLQRQLPGLQSDLPRLKEILGKIDGVVGQQEGVRDKKLAFARETAQLAERDRSFKVATEIEEGDAQKLEKRIAEIKEMQRDNPGDLSLGDPIELQGQLDMMRQALKLKQEIKDLEDRERTGALKPEEKTKLETLKKDLNAMDVSAINKRVARETEERTALLRTRGIEDRHSSFERNKAATENQIKEIERNQERNPFDLSQGDPIELKKGLAIEDENLKFDSARNQLDEQLRTKRISEDKYKADMAAEEKRHMTAIANINMEAEVEKEKRAIAKGDYDLENKQRTFEDKKKFVDTKSESLSLDGRDFEAKQLQQELAKEGQALELEAQINSLKKLAQTNPEVRGQLDATIAKLQELNGIKLDNLDAQWEKVLKDRATAINDRMSESQIGLLETQASSLSGKGLNWGARELQKEAAVMKQEIDFRKQTEGLEEFIKAQGVAADKAAVLRQQLQELGQVQMSNVKDQFSPWNDVLGSMTGGFKTFFSDVLSGSKSLKDAFTGLVDGILGSLANLAAEWLTNKLFGEIFGLGKSGKSGGDFMAGSLNGGGEESTPMNNIVPFGGSSGSSPLAPAYVSVVNGGMGGDMFTGASQFGLGEAGTFGGKGKTNFVDAIFGGTLGGAAQFGSGSPLPVDMVSANENIFSSLIGGFTSLIGGGGGAGGLGSIVSTIFGGGGSGGGGGLNVLSAVGSIFGLYEGGEITPDMAIQNYESGGIVGKLKAAIKKEKAMSGGKPAVPAVLTAGERVLSIEQNRRFEQLGGLKILNFSQGGRVPGGSFAKAVAEKSGGSNNSVSVNIPVNIQSGNDGSIDERKFKQVLDAKVRQVIQEESRQGGSLRRR